MFEVLELCSEESSTCGTSVEVEKQEQHGECGSEKQ